MGVNSCFLYITPSLSACSAVVQTVAIKLLDFQRYVITNFFLSITVEEKEHC